MIKAIKNNTDFIFRFNDDQKKALDSIENNPRTKSDFHTWTIITIALPILTFTVAAIFNCILSPNVDYILNNWPKFLLNGSVPIISFGIISSGVSYLMEELDSNTPVVQSIRRRVMGIAIIFLFLTSILYIFQSVSTVSETLKCVANLILLILSSVVCIFSISIGLKMYLLQNSMVADYGKSLKSNVDNMGENLLNAFGDGH